MKLSRKLAIAAASVVICNAANAQDSVQESHQRAEVLKTQSVRYSAGDSIPLGLPREIQKDKLGEVALAQKSVAPANTVRYSAGESIALEYPPKRTVGYSGASSIPLAGALGDSVTTHIGLGQAGLAEQNGLLNTSPAGLLGLFVIKAGIIYYFDHQESELRKTGLKASAGVWSGVTMNNLLLIAGSSNPLSLVGGALFGAYMYHREGVTLEKEDALKTAQKLPAQTK
jgi:hypothetical protein